MAEAFRVDVDARALLAALDRLDERIGVRLKDVARDTAERIQRDARARLARQTHGTGQTADAITVEDIRGGYRVFVGPQGNRPANLPIWLEFGTKRMTARPFLFATATLESGPHLRRVREAVEDAIAEVQRG